MSSYAPATDWDLIHRWEWFRRPKWRQDFRTAIGGAGGGPARAFTDLAKLVDAKLLLDASCGLGRRAIAIADQGFHILGSDMSRMAIDCARDLAREENSSVSFFRSSWNDLPKNIPHHFNGILVTGLNLEPSWDRLGPALVGLFHALEPGGFLMFTGAADKEAEGDQRMHMEEKWRAEPPEAIEWCHSENNTTCFCVRLRSKAADYLDDRLIYASEKNGQTCLESTTLRRPGYWTWNHWRDVTRMAGFSHLETREYPGFGMDGGVLRINVAWKTKASDASDNQPADDNSRNEPYAD